MIQEICAKLREKRKELGYRTEDVVEKTKLYPSVIKDIESGEFSKISPVYLKGFIKIYASFLGVNLGDSLEEIGASPIKKEVKPPRVKKQFPPRLKKTILVSLIGVFALFVFINITRAIGRKFHSRGAAASQAPQPRPEQKPPPPPKKKPAPPPASKEVAEARPAPGLQGRAVISITTKRQCFLSVKVDGKVFFEGILKKGVSETWQGHKEIEFKINDGSAALFEINGKSIPSLTSMRKPRRLEVTPKGWKIK